MISGKSIATILSLGALSFSSCTLTTQQPIGRGDVEFWLTTGDKSSLFENTSFLSLTAEPISDAITIEVDTTKTFQEIDGFGYSLTGGSAQLLNGLQSGARQDLLKELFLTTGNGIGISYLRVSLGASDLDDHVFSYADKPDPSLASFSLAEDEKHLIPILKEILVLNPSIRIMASPWSAPTWMKTNNLRKGGSLKPEHYATYAKYFVLYIQGMAKAGIAIDAVTIQNEPENPNNTPSMVMTADEQANFVKNHLGPAFEQAGIKTKIVIFDHNCDHPEYPITILNDPAAKKYIDGTAFHMYLGEINAMSKVHDAHPDKNLYFTEQWTSGKGEFEGDLEWHVRHLIVGASRNWSRTVLEWNLAADPEFKPHTDDGGCTLCQGALTIGDSVTRNVSYYIIAHASKHVRPGAVRIESSNSDKLANVAFRNTDGRKVVIVLNDRNEPKPIMVKAGEKVFTATLPRHSVATFVW